MNPHQSFLHGKLLQQWQPCKLFIIITIYKFFIPLIATFLFLRLGFVLPYGLRVFPFLFLVGFLGHKDSIPSLDLCWGFILKVVTSDLNTHTTTRYGPRIFSWATEMDLFYEVSLITCGFRFHSLSSYKFSYSRLTISFPCRLGLHQGELIQTLGFSYICCAQIFLPNLLPVVRR